MSHTPEAHFDVLALAHYFRRLDSDSDANQLHLFAYLACLLSLYRGNPTSDWGYQFAATASGAPFSTALNLALSLLDRSGALASAGSALAITPRGEEDFAALLELPRMQARAPILEAAASSALAIPKGMIRHAISQDPQIRASLTFRTKRELLDADALDRIYEEFTALSDAVGTVGADLIVPAHLWLHLRLTERERMMTLR